MPTSRRLLSLLGGAAAALLTSFFLPMAVGHAAGADGGPYETCDGAVCLVQDPGHLADWNYSGVRPLVTDWQGTQPYSVEVNGDDVGSYSITAEDTWTPLYHVWHYEYGDFTPAVAGSDPDLGAFAGQSGASVYDASMLNGDVNFLTLIDIEQHGHELSYYVTSVGDFTNVAVVDPVHGTSADFIQSGDSAPQFVYNSLFHGGFFPQVPDYLVPGDQFAGLDFNPGDFVDGDLAGL
jgi:hypothetical protein